MFSALNFIFVQLVDVIGVDMDPVDMIGSYSVWNQKTGQKYTPGEINAISSNFSHVSTIPLDFFPN